VEEELQRQTKQVSSREYALLQTVPGIGETLGLTLLYEIGEIERFPTVKDFLSYCRLVKGTVASAGKIKGLRGAKLGNALAYRNERGRQDRLYASCFLRSKRGKQMPGDDSASVGR